MQILVRESHSVAPSHSLKSREKEKMSNSFMHLFQKGKKTKGGGRSEIVGSSPNRVILFKRITLIFHENQ